MSINAQTQKVEAEAKYQALVKECMAESSNLDAINAERDHNYELKKAEAYEALTSGHNSSIVMSGQSGEDMISKIFEV